MMDTYWLEGVRGAISTSPKNENKGRFLVCLLPRRTHEMHMRQGQGEGDHLSAFAEHGQTVRDTN